MKKTYKQQIAEYAKQYRLLAMEYKKRMKEFKKAGISSPASNVLMSRIPSATIGKSGVLLNRPSVRSKSVYQNAIKELSKFMKMKTATIKGAEDVELKRLESLRSIYPELNSYKDSEINELLEFLGSQLGSNAKAKYDSDQVIVALTAQKKLKKNEGKSFRDIFEEMNESKHSLAYYLREVEESSKNDFIDF